MLKDPVCGMEVDASSEFQFAYKGASYAFCSEHCLQRFSANPPQFLCTEPAAPACASSSCAVRGAQYTCPMHPQVVSEQPGACPKCGMALEVSGVAESLTKTEYTCPMHPEVVSAHPGACPKCGMALEPVEVQVSEDDSELKAMSLRFWVCLLLSFPIFISAMGGEFWDQHIAHVISPASRQWLEFILSTPVVLWGGWIFFVRAYYSLLHRSLNMFTLIAMGVSVAWLYSLSAVFFTGAFPATMLNQYGLVAVYFEAAAVITTLVLLGQVLELKARSQTNAAIKLLLGLAPKTAMLIQEDGSQREVPIHQVQVGQQLLIRPGEKVPVDGEVLEGESRVDESMVSGEPIAVKKRKGAKLIGATLNTNGSLVMQVTRVGADTLLSQIVQMVSQAQRSRAPIQRLVDVVSSYFVPAVILSSVVTFFAWYVFGPEPALAMAIVNAVAVLIIACPCALGLATPVSIMVGTGRGALLGVLFKNAESLERMQRVDTLVVDKTGTLTQGHPELIYTRSSEGFHESELLRLAASLERLSEHPIAKAICHGVESRQIKLDKVEDFQSVTGKGLQGIVNGQYIYLGSRRFLAEKAVEIQALNILEEQLREEGDYQEGQTVVYLARGQQLVGAMGVADPIKETTAEAIQTLHQQGIRLVMLTGDSRKTAQAVAARLGIDRVEAEVLPEQKAQFVSQLQEQGHVVGMAGDGINDAPALAQADVGIAMGSGADVAMESAGITLVKGDLMGIVRARKLSRATLANIRQNLFFAFVYNSAGIPIAAGLLYPVFGLLLSPMIAALAMSFSSVSVIANALRLRRQAI